jgi:hypothetical protein
MKVVANVGLITVILLFLWIRHLLRSGVQQPGPDHGVLVAAYGLEGTDSNNNKL